LASSLTFFFGFSGKSIPVLKLSQFVKIKPTASGRDLKLQYTFLCLSLLQIFTANNNLLIAMKNSQNTRAFAAALGMGIHKLNTDSITSITLRYINIIETLFALSETDSEMAK
jgi:hypothetical protein